MSKTSKLAAAATVALILGAGAVLAQSAVSTGTPHAFSAEDTSIGELMANPAAKAVFAKYFPDMVADPRLSRASGMTLNEVRPFSGGAVTREKMAALDKDLRALSSNNLAPATEGAGDAGPPPVNEWITWGYDQQRTGWNRAETTLSKSNVAKLRTAWTAQLAVPTNKFVLSTMTAPVIVAGVATPEGAKNILFVLGGNDSLFALDADSGKPLWTKSFPNSQSPKKAKEWLCPGTTNDTPTVDKARGIVFFITSDGKLRGLNLTDGAERLAPVDMTAPFARAWSLNLVGSVVYSPSGRACGEVTDTNSLEYAAAMSGLRRAPTGPLLDASALNAADVSDLAHPVVTHFFTSGARPAAPWGRGGVVLGPKDSVYLETSDGRYDPASGDFSESILRLSAKAARLMDSYTPTNWDDNLHHDLSGSASPVLFDFAGKTLLAVSQKEAVLRILDANNLGGDNHMTPLWQSPHLGNDAKTGTDPSRGVWGGIATWQSQDGKRFLYLPLYGEPSKELPVFPHSNGPTPNGRVMAFQVVEDGGKISAVPVWTSTDMIMPDPPVVANGVVYALSTGGQAMQNGAHPGDKRMPYSESAVLRSTPVANMTLYAYDAETGKQLWSSKKAMADWVHFSEPVVALGKVFVVTHDAHVIAFGLKK